MWVRRCSYGAHGVEATPRGRTAAGALARTGPTGYATGVVSEPDARRFATETARIAAEHQAENLVVLDVRGISPVTDYFVIGSGTSERQMRAVFEAIRAYGATVGERPIGTAGYDTATWMLLDFVDVVIHIFAPKYREYYDLELLWGDAPKVAWPRPINA